ncbi:MAG: barstar family protein [Ruminococcus sp.]|nr:barstar family protein [Ruminococcus sp.]
MTDRRTLTIDGDKIKTETQLHKWLAEALEFPCWYGNNFDALFDMLSAEVSKPLLIRVINPAQLQENLGPAADVLSRVLVHAALENRHLEIDYDY